MTLPFNVEGAGRSPATPRIYRGSRRARMSDFVGRLMLVAPREMRPWRHRVKGEIRIAECVHVDLVILDGDGSAELVRNVVVMHVVLVRRLKHHVVAGTPVVLTRLAREPNPHQPDEMVWRFRDPKDHDVALATWYIAEYGNPFTAAEPAGRRLR